MTVPEGLAHTIAEVLAEHHLAHGDAGLHCGCGFGRNLQLEELIAHQSEMIGARLGIEAQDYGHCAYHDQGDYCTPTTTYPKLPVYRVRCLEPDPPEAAINANPRA